MKQLVFLICLLSASSIYGQNYTAVKTILAQGKQMEEQVNQLSVAVSRRKAHMLYLNADWQNSAVVDATGQMIYFNGRFSVLDRAIELKTRQGIRSISPVKVKAAMVGDRYFVVVPSDQLKENTGTAFYEILSIGKVNLYVLHILKSRMTGSNGITTAINGDKVYYISEQIYCQPKEGLCQKLKFNTKKILALFGDRKADVEAFAEENNLKFKSKEDLIRIFNFYNELGM